MFATLIGPDLTKLLLDLVYAAALGAITLSWGYIRAHTSVAQRALLADLAETVVPLMRDALPTLTKSDALNRGVTRVTAWLAKRGIRLDEAEIEAALERAWEAAQAKDVTAS
jgi:hypothetical protein